MGSRLLPLSLALAAAAADGAGIHRLGAWLVLLTIPVAAAAAVVAVSDVVEGKRAWTRAVTSVGALVLLLLASAVRHAAPVGAAVPPLALSAVLGAAVLYVLPVALWVLQPAAPAKPATSA
jgi:hypothetical protein